MKPSRRHLTISNHREWCLTNLSLRLRDDTHRSATCLRWASQTPIIRWCLTSSKGRNAALTTCLSRCGQRDHLRPAQALLVVSLAEVFDRCGGHKPREAEHRMWPHSRHPPLWELFKRDVFCWKHLRPLGRWSVSKIQKQQRSKNRISERSEHRQSRLMIALWSSYDRLWLCSLRSQRLRVIRCWLWLPVLCLGSW